jgi:hypothetical protein
MFKPFLAALLLAAPLGLALAPKANAYPYYYNSYSQNGYGSYSLMSGGYYGNINTYSRGNYSQANYYDNYGNSSSASCYRIGRFIYCSGH